MFYAGVARATSTWKSKVEAGKDPRVRRLYLLGRIGKARMLRMLDLAVESAFRSLVKEYGLGIYSDWWSDHSSKNFDPVVGSKEVESIYKPIRSSKITGGRIMPQWGLRLRAAADGEEGVFSAADYAKQRRAKQLALEGKEIPEELAVERDEDLPDAIFELKTYMENTPRKDKVRFWLAKRKAKKAMRVAPEDQDSREKSFKKQFDLAKEKETLILNEWTLADRSFKRLKENLGPDAIGKLADALIRADDIQREEAEAAAALKIRNKEKAEMYAAKDLLISLRLELTEIEEKLKAELVETEGETSRLTDKYEAKIAALKKDVEVAEVEYEREAREAEEAEADYQRELKEAEDAKAAEEERQRLELMQEEEEAKAANKSMGKEVKEMRDALRARDAARIEFNEAAAIERKVTAAAMKEQREADEAMANLTPESSDIEKNKAAREVEEAEFSMEAAKEPQKRLKWAQKNFDECEAAYQKELAEAKEAEAAAEKERQEAEDLRNITEAKVKLDKLLLKKDLTVQIRSRIEFEMKKQAKARSGLANEAKITDMDAAIKEAEKMRDDAKDTFDGRSLPGQTVHDKELPYDLESAANDWKEAQAYIDSLDGKRTSLKEQLEADRAILKGRRARKSQARKAARRMRMAARREKRKREAEEEKMKHEARERSGLNKRNAEDEAKRILGMRD